jgi:hypothetical protein
MTTEDESLEQSRRRRIVKARWAILRNALLNRDSSSTTINSSSQSCEQTKQHSIHRFKGYNLLNGRPVVDSEYSPSSDQQLLLSRIELSLCKYQWNSYQSLEENIEKLEIAILSLSACFPKGKCIRVTISSEEKINNNNSACWLASLQKRCQPSVRILNINEEEEGEVKEQKSEDSLSSTNNDIIASTSTTTTTTTTLLVQETSTSTNYKMLQYDLHSNDDNKNSNNNKNCDEPSSSLINTQQEGYLPSSRFRYIWTREPKEKRLTLDDLVSHRKNKGVDNTGNICVWDSEKTLAYLLYNHFDDFFTVTTTGAVVCNNNYDSINTIGCSCHDDNDNDNDDDDDDDVDDNDVDDDDDDDDDDDGTEYEYNKDNKVDTSLDDDDHHHRHSEFRIMELGTGMAGLSAVALGFRVEIRQQDLLRRRQQQQQQQDDECEDDETNKDNHDNKNTKKSVHIMLTDGNPDGVKNNTINQYLTRLNSNHNLNIKCDVLLWTRDCSSNDGDDDDEDQDVILVSDCVHFQNFHAALAITTFRCLRVGGTAIFCQPTRGPSLDNFLKLLSTATEQQEQQNSSISSLMSQSNNNKSAIRKMEKKKKNPLVRLSWLSHPIIEQKHQEACSKHNDVYDENLHKPKILVITKLRDMMEEDRLRFIAYQQRYSPDKPAVVHAVEG